MADGALSWDFLAYLRFCDGFENSLDSEGFRLWPADAMERVSTYDHGKFASRGSDRFLIFADYLHWSWGYAIELSPRGRVTIVGTADRQLHVIPGGFQRFLGLYLRDDLALYPG